MLYFLRESDLEEVLSLQTRMHNSAGVFLDPARRNRGYPPYHHHSGQSGSGAGTSVNNSIGSSSRPRTPNASPHGSPRKARRSPSHGKFHLIIYFMIESMKMKKNS